MKVGIIKNGDDTLHHRWVTSCKKLNIDYEVIDIFANNWIMQVRKSNANCFLLRPPGNIEKEKVLYDERLYILAKVMKKFTYPSYEDVMIYENKKLLRDYLTVKNIPHPETAVFYNKNRAISFIESTKFPIVGKTSIGASGSGVTIIKTNHEAVKYIKHAFSRKGIKKKFGPNRQIGNPKKWTQRAIKSPDYFLKKLKNYYKSYINRQNGFVILQEYIPHSFEWRAVRIGDSYFAHKKIKQGEMASGTKGIDYVTPPVKLLDFVKKWSDKLKFNSMAFDMFEDENGDYLVNELQTIFGHVQNYICAVNNKPGRYIYNNGWIFEEGDFNTNESYDLRLEVAIKLYNESKQ